MDEKYSKTELFKAVLDKDSDWTIYDTTTGSIVANISTEYICVTRDYNKNEELSLFIEELLKKESTLN